MKIAQVSLFPSQNGKKFISQSGVASYSKYLYTSIQKKSPKNLQYILAKILDSKSEYIENNLTILRIWNPGWKFPFQLLSKIYSERFDIVHFQQEVSLYGGFLSVPFFLFLLLMLKISNQKVLVTVHSVPDLTLVNSAFVKENNSNVPYWFARFAMDITFSSIALLSNKVIVHEDIFKKFLLNHYHFTGEKSIITIQHGVADFKKINKSFARKKLKLSQTHKIFLFMGYLTGYKGLELLINSYSEFSKRHENVYLILGAGIHPKLQNDKNYLQNVYERHKELAKNKIEKEKYSWKGFIPESEVGLYYSSADLVIFPYTVAMSSSGPMAISIGYETPFIASRVFSHFVSDPILLFEKNKDSLRDKLEEYFVEPDKFSSSVKKIKSNLLWDNIAEKYIELYNNL